MKKLILFFLLLIPALAQAQTATVEYTYSDLANYTVIVFMSETPGLDTQTSLNGGEDTDKDGVVLIGGIEAGKTYYARARAYHDVTGVPTGWSDEVNVVAPNNIKPTVVDFDPVVIPFTGSLTITIQAN